MTEPSPSDSTGSDRGDRREGIGLGSLSAGTLASLLDHLEARAELFQWEARQARARLVRRLLCLFAAVVMVLAAYAVGLVALVAWLVKSQGLALPVAAGWVALGHLLAGFILLAIARSRGNGELFPDSIAELRRDREALRRRSARTRPQDPQ
jgi:uncharacterized membrane protein YqjE